MWSYLWGGLSWGGEINLSYKDCTNKIRQFVCFWWDFSGLYKRLLIKEWHSMQQWDVKDKTLELTIDTPYLACEGEVWGVYCEYFRENGLCYHVVLMSKCKAKVTPLLMTGVTLVFHCIVPLTSFSLAQRCYLLRGPLGVDIHVVVTKDTSHDTHSLQVGWESELTNYTNFKRNL